MPPGAAGDSIPTVVEVEDDPCEPVEERMAMSVPAGEEVPQSGGDGLTIHVFDMGQADSMLVIGPGPDHRTLLVDLGEPVRGTKKNWRRMARNLKELISPNGDGDRVIDYFVVSHYHTDHIGGSRSGIAGLLNRSHGAFKIRKFIDVGDDGDKYTKKERYTKKSLETNIRSWLGGKVKTRESPKFGTEQIQLGPGVEVEIVGFAGKAHDADSGAFEKVVARKATQYEDNAASENDYSIALKISYGQFEMFTAGDLTGANTSQDLGPLYKTTSHGQTYTNVERHFVEYWRQQSTELDVEVYRASHHGSKKLVDSSARRTVGSGVRDLLDGRWLRSPCPEGRTAGGQDRVAIRHRRTVAELLARPQRLLRAWCGRRRRRRHRGPAGRSLVHDRRRTPQGLLRRRGTRDPDARRVGKRQERAPPVLDGVIASTQRPSRWQ